MESEGTDWLPSNLTMDSESPDCLPSNLTMDSESPDCLPSNLTMDSESPDCLPSNLTMDSESPDWTADPDPAMFGGRMKRSFPGASALCNATHIRRPSDFRRQAKQLLSSFAIEEDIAEEDAVPPSPRQQTDPEPDPSPQHSSSQASCSKSPETSGEHGLPQFPDHGLPQFPDHVAFLKGLILYQKGNEDDAAVHEAPGHLAPDDGETGQRRAAHPQGPLGEVQGGGEKENTPNSRSARGLASGSGVRMRLRSTHRQQVRMKRSLSTRSREYPRWSRKREITNFKQHLRVLLKITNLQERQLWQKLARGRVFLGGQICPLCNVFLKQFEKHLKTGHPDISSVKKRNIVKRMERELTMGKLRELEASNPAIPMVTLKDEPQGNSDPSLPWSRDTEDLSLAYPIRRHSGFVVMGILGRKSVRRTAVGMAIAVKCLSIV
ncbi:hypothetical protein E1301_Tti023926 [Triplophysa tibetana]|uniref:Uncharacterized protein n=1 Tax=Triplophysa tibetana TaxID=1572043 RepID=A0A5A9MWV4_9TELE|nr:hypothetical protein E1301_Tti023926 [Triplophysa tibetana]